MPKVLNKYKDGVPTGAVYIGRPSKWGNPFVIGKDGTREEVIAKYRTWLLAQPAKVEAVKRELAGKDLVCFCAPKGCHGDVLLEVANVKWTASTPPILAARRIRWLTRFGYGIDVQEQIALFSQSSRDMRRADAALAQDRRRFRRLSWLGCAECRMDQCWEDTNTARACRVVRRAVVRRAIRVRAGAPAMCVSPRLCRGNCRFQAAQGFFQQR